MKCHKCGFQNRPDLDYCTKCGTGLFRCKGCHAPVLADDMYCGQCGYKLHEKSDSHNKTITESEHSSIQRYLKKKTLNKALSRRSSLVGEERYLAALVCEMDEENGSMIESDQPDNSTAIKARILDILIHRINLYGGTVNEIVGDRVVAIFGGVIRLNDAPSRAVRSSWAIHRGIEKFEEELKKESNIKIKIGIRIGIHSGSQILKSVDEDLGVVLEGKEDLVKVCSMIAQNATPGRTYTSEIIFRHCYHEFRFEKLGKTNNEQVMLFRSIGPRERSLYGDAHINEYPGDVKNNSMVQSESSLNGISGKESFPFAPEYPGSTPWKSSTTSNTAVLSQKFRVLMFVIIFYFILSLFFIGEMLYPYGYFFKIVNFFESFWVRVIILVSILLVITFLVFALLNQLAIRIMVARHKEKRLGNMLLRNGYISEKELDQVLAEQNQRLGEYLVKTGTIDASQLKSALEQQKQSNERLGEILVSQGITSEEEIRQALEKLDRKMGEILRDRGILSEYTLYWILHRQNKRIKIIKKRRI